MIAVWYDPAHPAIYFGGSDRVFPPASLVASVDGAGLIEIWTASSTARIAGPAAYSLFADAAGNGFANAAAAQAYLAGEFAKAPSDTATILPVRVISPGGAAAISITRHDTILLIACGDVAQIALPPDAAVGQQFLIKDALGRAASSPITIVPQAGALIDGQPLATLSCAYESLTLVNTSNNWSLI